MKNNFKYLLVSTACFLSFLYGCKPAVSTGSSSSKEVVEQGCAFCDNLPVDEYEKIETLPHHTPSTFKEDSIEVEDVNICDGVNRYTYRFATNKNFNSAVVVTEIDLSKANIAAGSKDNSVLSLSKATPIAQAEAFMNANPGYQVVAAINADFFGGSSPVNAFVKDSVIIKNSHNDKGIYDYTNLNADIPASMPMLFGVSGQCAQVAPIIKNSTVEETIKSKLFCEIKVTNNNKTTLLSKDVIFNDSNGSKSKVNLITSPDCEGTALAGSTVLNVKKHRSDSTRLHGEVEFIQNILSNSTYIANEDYFYVILPEGMENQINKGDIISYNINSPDNTWEYYDTIIGCRQALVIDGNIPQTVSKENSNGAQSTNIPRTAIGVMPDGKVALFSVESLYYGKKNSSESDPHGLSLPELADFMRYFGVYNGANFDGGGSTQLISLNPTTKELEVVVRSSDYGTSVLANSRTVINTLLVFTKGE